MITRAALIAWIVALPSIRDGHGLPIPRPHGFAEAIVTVALEHDELDARILAGMLDVTGAHESGYHLAARGDIHDGVARSCGAWQTPCAETPGFARCTEGESCVHGWRFVATPHTGADQARVAAKWLIVSATACPDFPLSRYATGTICGRVRIADLYWREVRAELAIPLEGP